MYSWGIGAEWLDFLGLSCVSTMLCEPEASACRGSSFFSPSSLLNPAAMLICRVCWGQIHRTSTWHFNNNFTFPTQRVASK